MTIQDTAEAIVDDAREWCEGKSPWARGLLLAYLAYGGVRHMASLEYRTWFGGITLAIHELGHVFMSPFGRTLTILGGSLFQLLAPTVVALYLWLKQRDYFGFAVGTAWLAFSEWELAVYVRDANREELPLVSLGSGQPEHDWSTLLTDWHLLNQCEGIATAIRVIAFVTWAFSIAWGGWLVMTIARRGEPLRR